MSEPLTGRELALMRCDPHAPQRLLNLVDELREALDHTHWYAERECGCQESCRPAYELLNRLDSKLIPIVRKAIGSVEGRLEGVNLHKRSRFIVYHAVTKRAVTCEFDQDRLMEEVRFSIGKRVSVFGTLHKNIIGDTLRVTVERLEVVDENKRFTIPSIAGLKDPEFTEAKTTKEYLRRVRGR